MRHRSVFCAAESLELRRLLSTFVPPPLQATPTNRVQVVKVLVLNFEPTVPSEGNRPLWQIFGWNDPRQLASGFVSAMESASGGAIDYQVVDWRDLNEFPIFTDGFRYNADDYVEHRRTNSGWHDSASADFYKLDEQQHIAAAVNDAGIDEVWTFGDHYFGLFGEAWMFGPQSFFINGPSFPDIGVDRAVAGFGFNYERGVAEMVHNHSHRTENHLSRLYGGWNIGSPVTPWDLFTANIAQSSTSTYGVGSCHYPFNGASDYDYENLRVAPSYADDFVYNFPNQTYATQTLGRDAWGDEGNGDYQLGYMKWWFGHIPRASGATADGRQNNWYKYIYDFNSYLPDTGLPRDNQAILGSGPLKKVSATYDFTVRYYDLQGIDASSLGTGDILVTGPGGFSQLASLVSIGSEVQTTVGTARTVTYRITGPGGSFDVADDGSYSVSLRSGQVRDVSGNLLSSSVLGNVRVEISPLSQIDIMGLYAAGRATFSGSPFDIGTYSDIFDNNTSSLARTPSINPAIVTIEFCCPRMVETIRTYFSYSFGSPAYQWKVETANTLSDLDGQTGTYRLTVPLTGTVVDAYSTVSIPTVTAKVFRLTATKLNGDDYVHMNEWQLIGPAIVDNASPTASLLGAPAVVYGSEATPFTLHLVDDVALNLATINYGDVLVTGPNGFSQVAGFYGVDTNSGVSPRDATYFVAAPGGTWDFTDNGTYTISILANQIFDTSGKPVAAGAVGQFVVNIPTPQLRPRNELTELNASEWIGWAQDATATITSDTTQKLMGQASIRFDTDGGFDTSLRYQPTYGAQWNLNDATAFKFSVHAQNIHDFQETPLIRFIDTDGDSFDFTYYDSSNPYALWQDARGFWLDVEIPIKSGASPGTGWHRNAVGTPDWSKIRSIEIHADTWDAGFTLWFDQMGFVMPLHVTQSRYDFDSATPAVEVAFDQDVAASLALGDFELRNLGTGQVISSSQLQVTYSPTTLTARVRYTAGIALPDGNYRLTLGATNVSDVLGNTLAGNSLTDFHVLAGDLNRDRAVNFDDLLVLAQSYGQSGKTFSQGNIDYSTDGKVDFDDLLILAQRYGRTLGSASPSPLLRRRQSLEDLLA